MLNLIARFAKGLKLGSEANLTQAYSHDLRSFGSSSVARSKLLRSPRKSSSHGQDLGVVVKPVTVSTATQTTTTMAMNCTRPVSMNLQRSFLTSNPISCVGPISSNLNQGSLLLSQASSLKNGALHGLKNMNGDQRAGMATLLQMHRTGPHIKKRPPRKPLDGNPQMKGVVLKTLIKKPKKPNSANRKCVLVRLSNGKEKVAYVPGQGHNLQEHNIVLCRVGRLRDVPGVKIKCIRGKYDLPHVQKITRH